MTTTATPTLDEQAPEFDPSLLARLALQDMRYRAMAAGALLCEPVTVDQIRRAKALLEPIYYDALVEIKALKEEGHESLHIPDARDVADAARWRIVEQALIDWRDAQNFPIDAGGSQSHVQQQTRRNMVAAVEKALGHLKREREVR
jgi:hypothetical protein